MTRPGPTDGLTALPMPHGDPSGVWQAAGLLRTGASHVTSGQLVSRGGDPPWSPPAWAGPAADAAGAEVRILAGRVASLADRLLRAAAVLDEYGDALDGAHRTVLGLQTAYDSAVPRDPALAMPAQEVVALAGRYAVALADLDLAGDAAAHRLRLLRDEVGDSGRARDGWSDGADPRSASLAGLPIVTGRVHQLEADRAADDLAARLDQLVAGDPWSVDEVATLLQTRARDPVFAQALWARLPPDRLAVVLAALSTPAGGSATAVDRGWYRERVADAVQGLGVALATAANPAYATGLDVVSVARLAAWRGPWLTRLADASSRAVRLDDERAVAGGWVQGQLLAGARSAGLSPGLPYAATVGVALVAADRQARRANGVMDTLNPAATVRPVIVAGRVGDPVVALAEALQGDVVAARAWLLHPLPDDPGQLVVDHLVQGRYLWADARGAGPSMAAVGRLVVTAGSDPGSRDAAQVASAFVGAVGSEAVATPDRAAFRRVITPALGSLGTVLGDHPDAVTAALDESWAAGLDGASLTPAERLVRHGREAGTWEVVMADRATAAAVVGELAFDRTDRGAGAAGTTAAQDPAAAPALAHVLDLVGARLEADLVAAVAADHAGDEHAVDAAAQQLGGTVGFLLTAAGTALAGSDADADARNRALAQVADLAVAKIAIPGTAGRLATPLVRAAGERVVAAALPSGAEAAQRQATADAVERQREEALVAARTLVSRAHPWSDDQSPIRWAARSADRDPAPFWDETGTPLPEDTMTTAQRHSFTDWRRDAGLAVYDTVPQAVRDAVDRGVRDTTPPAAAAG